jgi:hypothetical protein
MYTLLYPITLRSINLTINIDTPTSSSSDPAVISAENEEYRREAIDIKRYI